MGVQSTRAGFKILWVIHGKPRVRPMAQPELGRSSAPRFRVVRQPRRFALESFFISVGRGGYFSAPYQIERRPVPLGSGTLRQPLQPFPADNPDYVGEIAPALSSPLLDGYKAITGRTAQDALGKRAAHPSPRRQLGKRAIAMA